MGFTPPLRRAMNTPVQRDTKHVESENGSSLKGNGENTKYHPAQHEYVLYTRSSRRSTKDLIIHRQIERG